MQGHRTSSAIMYDQGVKVFPRDYAEAFKWYKKAEEQGNTGAQNNLGQMYDRGLGIPRDYAEAFKWYKKAAEQGDAGAQFNLGKMYQKGKGVPKNRLISYMWYSLAAKKLQEAGK